MCALLTKQNSHDLHIGKSTQNLFEKAPNICRFDCCSKSTQDFYVEKKEESTQDLDMGAKYTKINLFERRLSVLVISPMIHLLHGWKYGEPGKLIVCYFGI